MEETKEQLDQPPPANITVQGDADIDYNWLEEQTHNALCFLHRDYSDVSIRIVTDEEMSQLHVKHSGVEGTTDVLTFDYSRDKNSLHADIAVCIDVADIEATKRGHALQNELLLYIVHGILHCCGFDDHNEEAHELMHKEEDRVLSAIGVGAVWSSET
ncbi:MAG: rRNA maturation RNase YbeY [Planctomycetes bacterium]|nr:rRNA maturation RNase YbeY [Planctomycetota bacterium]